MSDNTILELFQRSIAKGPFGKGKFACVYQLLPTQVLKPYVLKVRHEFLEDDSRLKKDVVSEKTYMYGVDVGFGKINVGQVMLADENRRVFGMLRQRGEPLEQRLEAHRHTLGDEAAVHKLLDELGGISDKDIRRFFDSIMRATRQRIAIDLIGDRNFLIDDRNRLKLVDVPVMLESYFEPSWFNHSDAVASYILSTIAPVLERIEHGNQAAIWDKYEQFHDRLTSVARSANFPVNASEVEQLIEREHIICQGIHMVDTVKFQMGDPPRMLKEALRKMDEHNQTRHARR